MAIVRFHPLRVDLPARVTDLGRVDNIASDGGGHARQTGRRIAEA
jgi:hypothetical protein